MTAARAQPGLAEGVFRGVQVALFPVAAAGYVLSVLADQPAARTTFFDAAVARHAVEDEPVASVTTTCSPCSAPLDGWRGGAPS